MHLYHYANNNPIKYTDPDGKAAQIAISGAAVEIVIAGVFVTIKVITDRDLREKFASDLQEGLNALGEGIVNIFEVVTFLAKGIITEISKKEKERQTRKQEQEAEQNPEATKAPTKDKNLNGKDKADDTPSWVIPEYGYPNKGETADEYAKRILDDKYGEGNWKKGANKEYNKIHKWAHRGLE